MQAQITFSKLECTKSSDPGASDALPNGYVRATLTEGKSYDLTLARYGGSRMDSLYTTIDDTKRVAYTLGHNFAWPSIKCETCGYECTHDHRVPLAPSAPPYDSNDPRAAP